MDREVTPYVGVWIEMNVITGTPNIHQSLPTWECGLKLLYRLTVNCDLGHSLRGSVD